MNNRCNDILLEDNVEQPIALNQSDDRAEESAWSFFNDDPMGHIDPNEELQPGECICGAFYCKQEYIHWTSGW